MSYKGYIGSVEYDSKDRLLYGKVLGVKALISYEGNSVDELENDFKAAINDYLKSCAKTDRQPEKPFSGTFNLRIDPELHAKAVIKAIAHKQSLNRFVSEAIEKSV